MNSFHKAQANTQCPDVEKQEISISRKANIFIIDPISLVGHFEIVKSTIYFLILSLLMCYCGCIFATCCESDPGWRDEKACTYCCPSFRKEDLWLISILTLGCIRLISKEDSDPEVVKLWWCWCCYDLQQM